MCKFGLSGCRVKPRRLRNGQLWPNMSWSFVALARAVAMASSGGIDGWVADVLRPLGELCATLPAGDRPPKQTFGCAPSDFVLATLFKCKRIRARERKTKFAQKWRAKMA